MPFRSQHFAAFGIVRELIRSSAGHHCDEAGRPVSTLWSGLLGELSTKLDRLRFQQCTFGAWFLIVKATLLLSSHQKPMGLVSIETVLFNDKQDNFSVCVEHNIKSSTSL